MSLPSGPKSWRRAAVSLCSAASMVAWMASCGVANVRWASFGAACSRAAPTTRPTATSRVSRRGLSFESIKLVFRMIRSYRCPPPPPPRMPPPPPPPREKPPPPLRAGPMLEYPWSLCVRAALPSRTPPKALRFWAGALGAIRRLPIRSPPDWAAPRARACPADPRVCKFWRTLPR